MQSFTVEDAVQVWDFVEVGLSVGVGSSVGYDGFPAASSVMEGMFVEKPMEISIVAGGGGRIPGPVTPGKTL